MMKFQLAKYKKADLAEGINLHRSNVIVNYDTPWNSTRLMQRIGRVNRIGSVAPFIHIFNFYPTAKVNNDIELELPNDYVFINNSNNSFAGSFVNDTTLNSPFSTSGSTRHYQIIDIDNDKNDEIVFEGLYDELPKVIPTRYPDEDSIQVFDFNLSVNKLLSVIMIAVGLCIIVSLKMASLEINAIIWNENAYFS